MARALSTLAALEGAGLISEGRRRELAEVEHAYAIGMTPHLKERIVPSDKNDPIFQMFVPDEREMLRTAEELSDPIGDEPHTPVKGVVHRYPDRVLLKPVGVCPVYCRFCFRREMVGPEAGGNLTSSELQAALDYIGSQPGVREVILTGGDPFMLSAERVKSLTGALGALENIRVIRWHTRMPVADPGRIDDAFIAALKATTKTVYVSVHVNHAREVSPETEMAFARMAEAGLPLLSQSVLLKNVNADPSVLAELFDLLTENRVRPYYLHHPDLAPGTGHFRVTVEEGQAIYRALRDRVSGISVPHYVIDIPGGVSKANAALSDVETEDGEHRLRGRDGQSRDYAG
ncbi:MAG: lysine 2,3-aminomutase [Ponticaulis sp.]|nr:lysine 2,3-aminomutase [Ponticaulis sp.]